MSKHTKKHFLSNDEVEYCNNDDDAGDGDKEDKEHEDDDKVTDAGDNVELNGNDVV